MQLFRQLCTLQFGEMDQEVDSEMREQFSAEVQRYGTLQSYADKKEWNAFVNLVFYHPVSPLDKR